MSERTAERGVFTLPAVAGIGVLLLRFVMVGQFAVWIYAKGVLRSAVQSAAREGAPIEAPPGSCDHAFELARRQLLGGELGRGVGDVRCHEGERIITVEVDAHFSSWLPFTPDWDTSVSAVAVREVAPA